MKKGRGSSLNEDILLHYITKLLTLKNIYIIEFCIIDQLIINMSTCCTFHMCFTYNYDCFYTSFKLSNFNKNGFRNTFHVG